MTNLKNLYPKLVFVYKCLFLFLLSSNETRPSRGEIHRSRRGAGNANWSPCRLLRRRIREVDENGRMSSERFPEPPPGLDVIAAAPDGIDTFGLSRSEHEGSTSGSENDFDLGDVDEPSDISQALSLAAANQLGDQSPKPSSTAAVAGQSRRSTSSVSEADCAGVYAIYATLTRIRQPLLAWPSSTFPIPPCMCFQVFLFKLCKLRNIIGYLLL